MRVERSFGSLFILVTLGGAACGGSPPPPPTAPEAAPTAPAASAAPVASSATPSKPATDEEGWAGENAAKNGDAKPAAPSEVGATAAPAADPKAPETRTMEVIRKLVVDNRKAARKCYEDARKDLKDLKGDVVVHFIIDPEGNVKSTELNQERSTLKSPAVVNCVMGVIKGIKFPKSSRALETSTNYPFNFTP